MCRNKSAAQWYEKMVKLKLVLGDPSGKTKQLEIEESNSKYFMGLKIGDTVKGETVDMPGYEFLITGGSDNAGFPMRRDVVSANRKKLLLVTGLGIRKNEKGRRVRRTVAGGIIGPNSAQINLKVTKQGKKPLFDEVAAPASAEAAPAKK